MNNKDTYELLSGIINHRTRVVMVAHLSGECNNPNIVAKLMHKLKYRLNKENISDWEWVVCRRDAPSSVIYYNEGMAKIVGGMNSKNSQYNLGSMELDEYF